ncbi:teicoplanin resistance associated membrane protein [Staphylococcus aureus]|nr:teicoplanin resistance associated membrane protein [Staphylococcus aureus]
MNDLTHFNKRSPIFIIILGSLTAIGALSIDMFLPGLPDIRHDFQTTTSNAQLTLSMFMIGLAFGNLFAWSNFRFNWAQKAAYYSYDYFYISKFRYCFCT